MTESPERHIPAGNPSGAEVHLPRWRQPAPGVDPAALERVLAAMPDGLDPAEIDGFLTTPNPNLVLRERIVTVGEFLAGGGDVEVVVGQARDLDRW